MKVERKLLLELKEEGKQKGAIGITGMDSHFVHHAGSGNIEFLSIGSAVHSAGNNADVLRFSSSVDAEELYCNEDAGYLPKRFVIGNIAYSNGIGRSITGAFKTLARGEIKEYSDIFNHTRHVALERIVEEARKNNANAVLSIETKILPYSVGVNEMLMIGTASHNENLPEQFRANPVSSDLSASELWSLTNMNMVPMKLVLGTSVYSLGMVGNITSVFKSFVKGELNQLTTLIYDAREQAIGLLNDEAKSMGADMVLGTKTYMYEIGNGLIEFFAIGTAVKKADFVKTKSDHLISQAIIEDRDSYFDYPTFNFGGQ